MTTNLNHLSLYLSIESYIFLSYLERLSTSRFLSRLLRKDTNIMGSVGVAPILRKNGETLPENTIEELQSLVACRVVVRGRAKEEEYKEAIDRWNQTGIKDAVSPYQSPTPAYFEMGLTKTRQS